MGEYNVEHVNVETTTQRVIIVTKDEYVSSLLQTKTPNNLRK